MWQAEVAAGSGTATSGGGRAADAWAGGVIGEGGVGGVPMLRAKLHTFSLVQLSGVEKQLQR